MPMIIVYLLFLGTMFGCSAHKLRWGIIGISKVADTVMIRTLQSSTRSELCAIASRTLPKAQEAAEKHHIPQAYGSYDDLLQDPTIDCVYIAIPNSLHAEWVLKAIAARKHVLCEKPLALNPYDIIAIQEAAYTQDVIVCEAIHYLYHPQTRAAFDLLTDKALGDILVIRSWFSLTTRLDRNNIRMHPELGGGCLWDKGCYPVSLAFLAAKAGLPTHVTAQFIFHPTFGVDTVVVGTLRFSNNVVATFDLGLTMPFREGVEIVGTQQTLIIADPWRPGRNGETQLLISDGMPQHSPTILTFPSCNPYSYEIQHMEACILDGATPIISLEDSHAFSVILNALHQAGSQGIAVKL